MLMKEKVHTHQVKPPLFSRQWGTVLGWIEKNVWYEYKYVFLLCWDRLLAVVTVRTATIRPALCNWTRQELQWNVQTDATGSLIRQGFFHWWVFGSYVLTKYRLYVCINRQHKHLRKCVQKNITNKNLISLSNNTLNSLFGFFLPLWT